MVGNQKMMTVMTIIRIIMVSAMRMVVELILQ